MKLVVEPQASFFNDDWKCNCAYSVALEGYSQPYSAEHVQQPSVATVTIDAHCSPAKDDFNAHLLALEETCDCAAPRATHLASWLLGTFGNETLMQGSGVVDIAAGRGTLSRKLCELCGHDLLCTLVEPDPPSLTVGETDSEALQWIEEPFDARYFPRKHRKLLSSSSVLLGFHPDEATEAIIDVSLRLGKPFAVVPCCVHTTLPPGEFMRRAGKTVDTYDEFIAYLLAKDPQIMSAYLPFEGRNRVLYMTEGRCKVTKPR